MEAVNYVDRGSPRPAGRLTTLRPVYQPRGTDLRSSGQYTAHWIHRVTLLAVPLPRRLDAGDADTDIFDFV